MKKLFILILNITIIFPLFSATHHHSDENEVRYISVNMELDPQYQQFLRENNLWNNFRNNHSNWFESLMKEINFLIEHLASLFLLIIYKHS